MSKAGMWKVESRGSKASPGLSEHRGRGPKEYSDDSCQNCCHFTVRHVSSTNVWSLLCAHLRHLRIFNYETLY
jgi:hypothetical protein